MLRWGQMGGAGLFGVHWGWESYAWDTWNGHRKPVQVLAHKCSGLELRLKVIGRLQFLWMETLTCTWAVKWGGDGYPATEGRRGGDPQEEGGDHCIECWWEVRRKGPLVLGPVGPRWWEWKPDCRELKHKSWGRSDHLCRCVFRKVSCGRRGPRKGLHSWWVMWKQWRVLFLNREILSHVFNWVQLRMNPLASC